MVGFEINSSVTGQLTPGLAGLVEVQYYIFVESKKFSAKANTVCSKYRFVPANKYERVHVTFYVGHVCNYVLL